MAGVILSCRGRGVGLALGGAVKREHITTGGQGTGKLEGGPCGMGKALMKNGVNIQA